MFIGLDNSLWCASTDWDIEAMYPKGTTNALGFNYPELQLLPDVRSPDKESDPWQMGKDPQIDSSAARCVPPI